MCGYLVNYLEASPQPYTDGSSALFARSLSVVAIGMALLLLVSCAPVTERKAEVFYLEGQKVPGGGIYLDPENAFRLRRYLRVDE